MKIKLEKHKREATDAGLIFIGKGRNDSFKTYKWVACGHVAEYQTGAVRDHRIKCRECAENIYRDEAQNINLELIGKGRDAHHKKYRFVDCGHIYNFQTAAVRRGGVKCKKCFDEALNEKLKNEAMLAGLEIIGEGKNFNFRKYRWIDCGHVSQYVTAAVRINNVNCQVCNKTSWVKKSNVYLLIITATDERKWLKFGVAQDIEVRSQKYGLQDGCKVEIINSAEFETRAEATSFEKNLHSKYALDRLPRGLMKTYHTKGGFTECYPIDFFETLNNHIELVKAN